MVKLVQKFVSITQIGETETRHEFKAVIIPSYGYCYRIIVTFISSKSGVTVKKGNTILYFDTPEEMLKEFEYHYHFFKNDQSTKFFKEF